MKRRAGTRRVALKATCGPQSTRRWIKVAIALRTSPYRPPRLLAAKLSAADIGLARRAPAVVLALLEVAGTALLRRRLSGAERLI